jgi:hypothetical protein
LVAFPHKLLVTVLFVSGTAQSRELPSLEAAPLVERYCRLVNALAERIQPGADGLRLLAWGTNRPSQILRRRRPRSLRRRARLGNQASSRTWCAVSSAMWSRRSTAA